jgi:hypothetical protein
MIWLIAINQISTSKKPRTGAIYFLPLDTKIMRNVPIDTSKILETKIKRGRITHENKFVSISDKISIIPPFEVFCLPKNLYYVNGIINSNAGQQINMLGILSICIHKAALKGRLFIKASE